MIRLLKALAKLLEKESVNGTETEACTGSVNVTWKVVVCVAMPCWFVWVAVHANVVKVIGTGAALVRATGTNCGEVAIEAAEFATVYDEESDFK